MKKNALFLVICMLVVGSIAEAQAPSAKQEQIERIDFQISQLNAELHKYRMKYEREEMEAQPMMLDSWTQYAEEIKDAEVVEKQVEEIKVKIRDLQKQKQALLNSD